MSLSIKSSTRINSATRIGPTAAFDLLSYWGVSYSNGVTLANVAGYDVPAGINATITGPLTVNDGVTLTVPNTSTLVVL
jgi:hypothetical protein